MFYKYISAAFKKNALKYIIIVVCEIAMISVSLFASAIIMNYKVEDQCLEFYANEFYYTFYEIANAHFNLANLSAEEEAAIEKAKNNLPDSINLREKIYDFCKKASNVYYIDINLTNLGDNFYWNEFYYFPTYEKMVHYFTEELSLSVDELPTKEQYLNHDKVVILGTGPDHDKYGEYVFNDDGKLLFGKNNDAYKVVTETPETNASYFLYGSEPDNAKFRCVHIYLDEYYSKRECEKVEEIFRETVAGDLEIYDSHLPLFDDLLDTRKEASVVTLTALMIIISAFNVVMLFKYIIDEKKTELAVFRLCGYSKRKAMLFPLAETVGVSVLCAVVSSVMFWLAMPLVKKICPTANLLYDFGFFAVFILCYVLAALFLFAVYILPSLKRSVSDELREM